MPSRPQRLGRLATELWCLAAGSRPRIRVRLMPQLCSRPPARPAFSTLSLLKASGTGLPAAALLAGVGGAGLFSLAAALHEATGPDSDGDGDGDTAPAAPAHDTRDPSVPRYRLSDIHLHDASHPNPWVIHQDKVYDITDWVSAHPGGDVILRAAGQSIDPYWAIFTIHNQHHVREILDQYLIGYIHAHDLVDGLPPAHDIQDPFASDPLRDPRLRTHTAKPCNAEPPNQALTDDFLTPNELFYKRNHMWVPAVEDHQLDQHTLTVELPSGDAKSYTLRDLKTRFTTHRVTAVLQCSGNRRSDMTRHVAKTNGLQWGVGAISNAEWQGVRLADVLADAGLEVAGPDAADDDSLPDPSTHHVQLTGLEAYGASIPLATALDPRNDVILAFGMNGKPLPRDHGSPLRAVVPGHVAARSVKWLSKIVIADEESTSQWQRRDYKSFGPNERNVDWDSAPAIQETPVTSAITKVLVGQCVRQADKFTGPASLLDVSDGREPVALEGYAVSGGGRCISRVDVSLDGGRTWDQAELLADPGAGHKAWAWKRWRYLGHLTPPAGAEGQRPQCAEVVVKATDSSYNTQPETHSSIFNVRGNLANAWHRVKVCPECVPAEAAQGESGMDKVVWRTGRAYGCGFGTEKEDAR
ncbi:hypothetical protein INS49_002020 [Diaporthe citri]|uniref:uncharacterized protein n=1 Tax=Diaporthe citri TaxID=83186 RepID=UPI001C81232D|nr:uncharacterized protein INS49_002020 [Diaporthe citri]KAG6367825.1 hypothetical protein INS49_002020 [Diaporthe citri]